MRVRVHTDTVTIMETEHWFCGFPDKSRLNKGLPSVNPETGELFCCPKSCTSFRNFKIHAGKSHSSELKSSGQLKFKHVFSRPPGANARSVAPVLRNAAASGQSHGDADPESESDSDPDSKQGIKELLARMIHDQRVGSPSDTDDESGSSEEERTAYSEGLHNFNEGRRSEVSDKNVIYKNFPTSPD